MLLFLPACYLNYRIASKADGCSQFDYKVVKSLRVVIPLCGGNIDSTVLGRCIDRGLAADGRLCRFIVTVSDRPGGIAELTRLLASLGASVKDIFHERAWLVSSVFNVQIKVVLEVRDCEHGLQVKEALQLQYPSNVLWGLDLGSTASTS